MSMRSFLEFNHDRAPRTDAEQHEFGRLMSHYARASDHTFLPRGMRKIDTRHHSDRVVAAREGYGPAQDECDIEAIADMISSVRPPSAQAMKKARAIFEFLTRAKEPRF